MGEQCRNHRMKLRRDRSPKKPGRQGSEDSWASGCESVQAVSNPLQVQEGAEWLNLVTHLCLGA